MKIKIEKFREPVYVTKPVIPDRVDLHKMIDVVFDSGWLTNHGRAHNELECLLEEKLNVSGVSLFNNGTIALMVALKALNLPVGSEVITTPFTFPATINAIEWNGLVPVFCDIDEHRMTLDSAKIEALVTDRTSAILGVHVYGIPCDVYGIDKVAKKHSLRVVYDAAHAFLTEFYGRSIASFGDVSMFSFHATKIFHTVEGGCLAYGNSSLKDKIYSLRNFGIQNEEKILGEGINGKMNEVSASIGLLNFKNIDFERERRAQIRGIYSSLLGSISGLNVVSLPEGAIQSEGYMVLRVNEKKFGMDRNNLYEKLKSYNVFSRKYFSPLCSENELYENIPSASQECLPIAHKVKDSVLCLPFYGSLSDQDVVKVCEIISHIYEMSRS